VTKSKATLFRFTTYPTPGIKEKMLKSHLSQDYLGKKSCSGHLEHDGGSCRRPYWINAFPSGSLLVHCTGAGMINELELVLLEPAKFS
jgi:hypothetical protein